MFIEYISLQNNIPNENVIIAKHILKTRGDELRKLVKNPLRRDGAILYLAQFCTQLCGTSQAVIAKSCLSTPTTLRKDLHKIHEIIKEFEY